ncbi:MAG: GAF domain-containing protein [Chloroflexota bacterium]
MSQLFAELRSLFRLHYLYVDPYDALRARGILAMSWAFVGLLVLYLPIDIVTVSGSLRVATAVGLTLTGFFLLVIIALVNRGELLNASLGFIILLYALVSGFYAISHNPPYLLQFSIPIIASGVLLNRRGMLVMLGLVILAVIGSTALASMNVFGSDTPPDGNSIYSVISGIVILIGDGIMLIVFAGGQRILQRRNLMLTRELRSSTSITQTIAGIQSLDDLLTQAVTLIRDQLNYYHVRIFLLEEKSHLLVLRAGTTLSVALGGSQQRRIAPDDPSILNEVVRSGQILRLSAADPESRRGEFLTAMRSEICMPLRRENIILGVLDVQSANSETITDQDLEVLSALAAQIAIAIQNTRLFSELQNTRKERQQLTELLRQAGREIDQLNREVSGRAWTRYLEGRSDNVIGYDLKQGVTTGSTQMTLGLEHGLDIAVPELFMEGDEQILSVPIISRGQVLGVMEFRTDADRTWNKRSIELAHVISQRLALALDNIRLFEQSQIIASREQTASQIAANLQTKTDLDILVTAAAEAFRDALGASRTSIRLGTPTENIGEKIANNGSHLS